ncbi:MAG: hypothetical protein HQM12_23125 [SAR324 cluster bacterium]|nr:hypothetical protein [SAR324 cluster bacterium]MBF0350474.1 hypothetical protein [SAR324 cluster bacterium]
MPSFSDVILSNKAGYRFEIERGLNAETVLLQELTYHMNDLEHSWMYLCHSMRESGADWAQKIKVQQHVTKISYRLDELLRFIGAWKGPTIVSFLCTEIRDFITEPGWKDNPLTLDAMHQVEGMLIIANCYLRPELNALDLINLNDVINSLKHLMEKFLTRYAGKNREESLKALSNLIARTRNDIQ